MGYTLQMPDPTEEAAPARRQGNTPKTLLPVELTADEGKIHLGFDPPNLAEGRDNLDQTDKAFEYWASVVKGKTNDHVNVVIPESFADKIEFQFEGNSGTHAGITTGQYTDGKLNISIEGKGTGPAIELANAKLVIKNTDQELARLKIHVLPEREEISVKVYVIEDSTSPSTKFSVSPVVAPPSDQLILETLNDSYKQAGVRFVIDPASTSTSNPTNIEYDTDDDGKMSDSELSASAIPSSIDPEYDGIRVFLVKNSGIPYDQAPDYMVRGFANSPGQPPYNFNFVSNSNGYTHLVVAHEIGHNLGLSVVNDDGPHDQPPFPKGVVGDNPHGLAPTFPGVPHKSNPNYALMQSGSPEGEGTSFKLPWIHGRWIRSEGWEMANETAKDL